MMIFSSGYLYRFVFASENARRIVRIPTRPINIMQISTSLDRRLKLVVKFKVKPTVAIAEITSKQTLIKGAPFSAVDRTIKPKKAMQLMITEIAIALFTDLNEILL